MKPTWIIGCVVAIAVAAAAWHMRSRPSPSPAPVPGVSLGAVLGVEELMRHVDQHRGRVEVEGVVAGDPANQNLALIDRKEFEECGLKGCTSLVLPARWAGSMPRAGQIVRLQGQVQEVGGKLIFVADSLDPLAVGGSK